MNREAHLTTLETISTRRSEISNQLIVTLLWLKRTEKQDCISSDHSKPTKGEEYKSNMSFPLCASRKHHTCFLLMASIEKKKASERERVCVCAHESEREKQREGGGQRERESKNVPNRLFLFSFSFPRMHIHLAGHVTWWLPLSVLLFRGSPQSMLSQFKL